MEFPILLVEDDTGLREALAEMLEDHAYTVKTAGSARIAFEIAEAVRPRIAVVDLSLDGSSGYELAERLRARWPEIRIFSMSGNDRDEREHVQHGVERHFLKPFRIADLLDAIGAPGA